MMTKRISRRVLPLAALCLLLCGIAECPSSISPPEQPDAGPGGKDYTCDPETEVFFDRNEAWLDDYLDCYPDPTVPCPLGGFIYAPACHSDPDPAPVVFFFHVGTGDQKEVYEGFHRHLAAKGYIVIAPRSHRPPLDGNVPQYILQTLEFGSAALMKAGIMGAKEGLEYYEREFAGRNNKPFPKYEGGELVYGVVGHSIGTSIAVSLANPTKRNEYLGDEAVDFPWNPKAVVMMNGGAAGDLGGRCPGLTTIVGCTKQWSERINNPDVCPYGLYPPEGDWPSPLPHWADPPQQCMATDSSFITGNLEHIDYNPLWIVMAGEDDWEAGDTAPLQAYCKATQIHDKHYLRLLTDDDSGQPDLVAKHVAPAGRLDPFPPIWVFPPIWTDQEDALDYWAYWKVVTGAMNCELRNLTDDCKYAKGGTADQIDMGEWSDGTPVKKMQYNPRVRGNDGVCYDLEDACALVNTIVYEDPDSDTRISAWNWRDKGVEANCDP